VHPALAVDNCRGWKLDAVVKAASGRLTIGTLPPGCDKMIRLLLSVLMFYFTYAMADMAAMYLGLAGHQDDPKAALLYEQYGSRCLLIALTAGAGLLFVLALQRKRAIKIPQYRLRTLLLLPVPVAIWGGLWASAARPIITISVFVIGGSLILWMRRRSYRTDGNVRSSEDANPAYPQGSPPAGSTSGPPVE
jgi:hypothetical protein